MPKRKSKTGVWHHRVPDFQLVYCGAKTQGEVVKAGSPKRKENANKKRIKSAA